MALRTSHVTLTVRDIARMLDFYCGALGFTVTDRGPAMGRAGNPELVFLSDVPDEEHHQLALLERPDETPGPGVVHHFAFRLDSLDELIRLDRATPDAPPLSGLRRAFEGDAWALRICDPEGNGVELFCATPWWVRHPYLRPMDISFDADDLEAWSIAALDGIEHGPRMPA